MRAASRLTKMSVSDSSATTTTLRRFCARRRSLVPATTEFRQWLFSRRGVGSSPGVLSALASSRW